MLTYLAFFAVFAIVIFVALSMLESRSANGAAFRLLCKMTAHGNTGLETAEALDDFVLGRRLRTFMPRLDERLLRPLLHGAGYYTEKQADVAALCWLTMLALAVLLASLLPGPTPLWCLLCFISALLGPHLLLRLRARKRRAAIASGLPEFIDLLVICVEAGLGLDQAVQRVNEELASTHPELNSEFNRLIQHQRAGMPRLEAWQKMGERLCVPDMDAFVSMVLQAERFGTPIARALSEFATLSRQKRMQAAEQAAAKTTVKISFPLILFIFPCIFIVLLGPALLNMARSLAGLAH